MTDRRETSPPTPWQFTLRDAALGFLLLCFWLAMSLQFGFMGFMLAGYTNGLALGWRLRRDWLKSAAAVGWLVFVISLASIWWSMGTDGEMGHNMSARLENCLDDTQDAVKQYQKRFHELPESLEILCQTPADLSFDEGADAYTPMLLNEFASRDPWEHPFDYHPNDDGTFVLRSLGADGKPGGWGWDADISLADPRLLRRRHLNLHDYMQAEAYPGVLFSATVASLFAAFIGHGIRPAWQRWSLAAITAIVVASAIVAFFLAAVHVALSQESGH